MSIVTKPGDDLHDRIWNIMFYKWGNEWCVKSNGRGITEMAEPFLNSIGAKIIKGSFIEFEKSEDATAFILKWS